MSILKHQVEISDYEQLEAYIDDEHGKIKGIYWKTEIDGTMFGDQTEVPLRGTYSRQLDEDSGKEFLVFTAPAEDRVHSYSQVIPESVALNGFVVVFSRKNIVKQVSSK